MKYLILSDIHSNYQAFTKILNTEKFDEVLFVGDIIGYGADPYFCYKKFLELGGTGVLGNHEQGVLEPETLAKFSENARKGILYTIKHIPKEYIDHMRILPAVLEMEDFVLCHAMLGNPLSFQYVFPENKDSIFLMESFEVLEKLGKKIQFTGHTHRPCIFKKREDEQIEVYPIHHGDIYLDDASYVINVGSVGQSRNGIPKAHYIIYDSVKRRIRFRALDYDIKEAADRILKADLPEFLGQRLYLGT